MIGKRVTQDDLDRSRSLLHVYSENYFDPVYRHSLVHHLSGAQPLSDEEREAMRIRANEAVQAILDSSE